jgi:hypothetical protein
MDDLSGVTWKDYTDSSSAAVRSEVAGLGNHVDKIFAEHQRAADSALESIERQMSAFKEYVNRVFTEHERAVTLTQQQTAAQVAELHGTTARLEYVNAVFQEHRRAIDTTLSGNERAIEVALVQVEQRLEQRNGSVSQRFQDIQTQLELSQQGRKEYVDRVFVEQQRAIDTALVQVSATQTAQQRAVEVALVQVEQRIHVVQDLSEERVGSVRREAIAALAASEKAIIKSEASSEKRFEAVNEFRQQLSDQSRAYMPREVAEALIAELRRTSENSFVDLRRSWNAQITEMRSQMISVQQRLDQAAGATAGSTKTIAYVVTGVSILMTIIVFAATHLTPH